MMVVPRIVRLQPGAGGLNRRDGHEGFRGIEGFGGEKNGDDAVIEKGVLCRILMNTIWE